MTENENVKLDKFNGKLEDDSYHWRLRAEMVLRGKGYWDKLNEDNCPRAIKDKASSLLISGLGKSAFPVCSSAIYDPLKMLELLDARFASKRATTRISVLTAVYQKKYSGKQDMDEYVNDFANLFSQLERMGKDTAVPETHKAPLLLASIGHGSSLESTVAALRLKDTEHLTWESVTSDLIQEWKRTRDDK